MGGRRGGARYQGWEDLVGRQRQTLFVHVSCFGYDNYCVIGSIYLVLIEFTGGMVEKGGGGDL